VLAKKKVKKAKVAKLKKKAVRLPPAIKTLKTDVEDLISEAPKTEEKPAEEA